MDRQSGNYMLPQQFLGDIQKLLLNINQYKFYNLLHLIKSKSLPYIQYCATYVLSKCLPWYRHKKLTKSDSEVLFIQVYGHQRILQGNFIPQRQFCVAVGQGEAEKQKQIRSLYIDDMN